MERDCVICGTGFVARNSRRRFCSDRCRKRAVRGGFGATVSAAKPRTPSGPGAVERATGEALRAVGRLGTPLRAEAKSPDEHLTWADVVVRRLRRGAQRRRLVGGRTAGSL